MTSMGPLQSMIFGNPNIVGLFQTLREKRYVQFAELDQVIFHSIEVHNKSTLFTIAWKCFSAYAM